VSGSTAQAQTAALSTPVAATTQAAASTQAAPVPVQQAAQPQQAQAQTGTQARSAPAGTWSAPQQAAGYAPQQPAYAQPAYAPQQPYYYGPSFPQMLPAAQMPFMPYMPPGASQVGGSFVSSSSSSSTTQNGGTPPVDDCVQQRAAQCPGDASALRIVACPPGTGFATCYESAAFKCYLGAGGKSVSCALSAGPGAQAASVSTVQNPATVGGTAVQSVNGYGTGR
jgi:hypothetical protein